jgi:hypothetical protein
MMTRIHRLVSQASQEVAKSLFHLNERRAKELSNVKQVVVNTSNKIMRNRSSGRSAERLAVDKSQRVCRLYKSSFKDLLLVR